MLLLFVFRVKLAKHLVQVKVGPTEDGAEMLFDALILGLLVIRFVLSHTGVVHYLILRFLIISGGERGFLIAGQVLGDNAVRMRDSVKIVP